MKRFVSQSISKISNKRQFIHLSKNFSSPLKFPIFVTGISILGIFLKLKEFNAKEEPKASRVFNLTTENFESIVEDVTKDVLVQFMAPWCIHCQRLIPEYENLAEEMKNQENLIISLIDLTKEESKFEVKGIPTLIFFPKGNKKGITYNGPRNSKDMADFIKIFSK
jgi:protein disulfide-isomerase-like protein